MIKVEDLDTLFRRLLILPLPETTEEKMEQLIDKVLKGELYQKDAVRGGTEQPIKKG